MFTSIRARLIASFLLLTAVTLFPLGYYILWFFHQNNLERLTADLLNQAQIVEHMLASQAWHADKERLDAQTKDLGHIGDLRITIIDVNGVVLADSAEPPSSMENHRDRPEVASALAGQNGTSVRYSATLGQNFLYAAIPWHSNQEIVGVVRSSTSLAHVEAAFDQIRIVLLIAFAVLSLLVILLGIQIAARISSPLEEVTRAAKKMAQGRLEQRSYVRTNDEIGVLAHTLNNLASGLTDKINEITGEKRKLELILDNMDNGVILLDQYGRITDANFMARNLFSILPIMLGTHNLRVIGSTVFDRNVREVAVGGPDRTFDLSTHFQKNARTFQVFMGAIADSSGESGRILCVFHDITVLKQLQDRQSEFVANASHELMTPLTAIKGFAETLAQGAIEDPTVGKKFVGIIEREADRMHRLVRDLLQLAKLDSHEYRSQQKNEPVEVKAIIENVTQEFAPRIAEKQLHLVVEPSTQPVRILANYDGIKQVLVNLLDNSIKYTPSGGSIQIRYAIAGQLAEFTFQDTGIGIPVEDQARIFDRFYRVDRARARSAGGTGLGLSIVKDIIDALGGSITLKSTENEGTTFIFTLPLAPDTRKDV